MPSYNLTPDEVRVLWTVLYSPNGYLDSTKRITDLQTAHHALFADPSLDITEWVRNNPQVDPANAIECALCWWAVTHDQVNITPPNRPPETPDWVPILEGWVSFYDHRFGVGGVAQRDQASRVPMWEGVNPPELEVGLLAIEDPSLEEQVRIVTVAPHGLTTNDGVEILGVAAPLERLNRVRRLISVTASSFNIYEDYGIGGSVVGGVARVVCRRVPPPNEDIGGGTYLLRHQQWCNKVLSVLS